MQRLAVLALVVFSWSAPLGAAEKTVEELIRQLGSSNFDEREQAAKDLVALGPKALEPLRKALDSSDKEVARRAKECIPIIERNMQITALIADLKDQRSEVRKQAVVALFDFGSHAAAGVPALVQALDDPDVRAGVANVLARIGPPAKPAIPKMVEILRDRKAPYLLRHAIALGLGVIDPDAVEPIPVLLEILENDDVLMKKSAATGLGQFKIKDKRVIEALLAVLKHDDLFLRSNAAIALGRIQQEPSLCVPALMDMLKKDRGHKGDDPRPSVLTALGYFGKDAKSALPLVLDFVKEHQGDVDDMRYLDGLLMLQKLGPHAREAVPELNKMLEKASDRILKEELLATLKAIGGPNP